MTPTAEGPPNLLGMHCVRRLPLKEPPLDTAAAVEDTAITIVAPIEDAARTGRCGRRRAVRSNQGPHLNPRNRLAAIGASQPPSGATSTPKSLAEPALRARSPFGGASSTFRGHACAVPRKPDAEPLPLAADDRKRRRRLTGASGDIPPQPTRKHSGRRGGNGSCRACHNPRVPRSRDGPGRARPS
jgi:hypothetical protein